MKRAFSWIGSKTVGFIYIIFTGLIVYCLTEYGGIGVISEWVGGFMDRYRMDVRYIVFGVAFAISFVLVVSSISLSLTWLTLWTWKYIRSRSPSSRLKKLSWDIGYVVEKIDSGELHPSEAEIVERIDFIMVELENICAIERSQENYHKFLHMIERPAQLGDVKRIRYIRKWLDRL